MEAAHNPQGMATWKHLPVGTDLAPSLYGEEVEANVQGLTAQVEDLHASFHSDADHLNQVQSMHEQVLVSAGMLPETHLADVQPERQLKWMVEALHGKVNPDGLTIPLLGVTAEEFDLHTKQQGEITLVRLVVKDGENDPLEREMPVPSDAEKISAHYLNGRLHLRW